MNGFRLALLISFGCIVATFILWAFLVTGIKVGEINYRTQQHNTVYERQKSDIIKSKCNPEDTEKLIKCVTSVIEETNEYKNSQDDLNAQQSMSLWALLMLIVNLLMALITAAGVYYVRKTLLSTNLAVMEAKKGNESAIKAAEASADTNKIMLREMQERYRPRLVIHFEGPYHGEGADDSLKYKNEETRHVAFTGLLFVENKGSSPATILGYGIKCHKPDPSIKIYSTPYDTDHNPSNAIRGRYNLDPGEVMILDTIGEHIRRGVKTPDELQRIQTKPETWARYIITEDYRLPLFRLLGPIEGYVIHMDPLGIVREKHFAFSVCATGVASARIHGGDELNYEIILPEGSHVN